MSQIMGIKKMINGCKQCSGQAMAEFIISVGTVLLALFLIVPLFGKLFDLQFTTQMAARYTAWERTVWFDQGEDPDESTLEYVAQRSDLLVKNAAENRFYSSPDRTIQYLEETDVSASNDIANPLWVYRQSGESMLQDYDTLAGTLDQQDTPAASYVLIDSVNDGLDVITGPIKSLLSIVGNDNDDFLTIAHSTRSYYNPSVYVQLDKGNAGSNRIESWIFGSGWDGRYEVSTGILADGWSAQSYEYFEERVDDGVISTVLDNDPINTFLDIVGTIETSVEDLEFGWVGTEPLPDVDVECEKPLSYCYFGE